MTRFGRRAFLGAALLGAAGCDTQRTHEGFLGAMERWNDGAQRLLFRERKLARDERAVTKIEAFPVYHIADEVPAAPPVWKLEIKGLCARPLSLSIDDLKRMPRTDIRVRHYCVEGWSAVASWHGVRLSEIAAIAGASPKARFLEFRSFDRTGSDEDGGEGEDDSDEGEDDSDEDEDHSDEQGGDREPDAKEAPGATPASGRMPYYSSWDRKSAEHAQTMLAYGMNGRDLGADHGAPVRLYSGVKLGYKMVKYLTEVIYLPERTGGFWEDQGYEWFAGV
jgi:DMSO/TMAO reductase YedYZ molybdopterin-dependent catalytic subunit